MNPTQTTEDERLQNVDNPLKVMQTGERVLCEIKRHPVGLWGVYFSVGLLIIAIIVGIVLALNYVPNMSSTTKQAMIFGGIILAVIALLYGYVARVVYTGNRWIVTSDSLTQIDQISLFRKRSSQLSLANLEDVSVIKDGLLQSMVGFGTLKVETAGEHSKFTFPFCPHPEEYAKKIIGAHEAYIAAKPDEMRVTNRPLANAAGFNQTYGQPVQQPSPAYEPAQSAQPVAQQQYNPGQPQSAEPAAPILNQPQQPTPNSNPDQQN